jgi:hypothetical protein
VSPRDQRGSPITVNASIVFKNTQRGGQPKSSTANVTVYTMGTMDTKGTKSDVQYITRFILSLAPGEGDWCDDEDILDALANELRDTRLKVRSLRNKVFSRRLTSRRLTKVRNENRVRLEHAIALRDMLEKLLSLAT